MTSAYPSNLNVFDPSNNVIITNNAHGVCARTTYGVAAVAATVLDGITEIDVMDMSEIAATHYYVNGILFETVHDGETRSDALEALYMLECDE